MARYTIILTAEPDGSAYNVIVPDLPGCFTWGATIEEALAHAREAIELHLEGYAERSEPIPVEGPPPHVTSIEVSLPAA